MIPVSPALTTGSSLHKSCGKMAVYPSRSLAVLFWITYLVEGWFHTLQLYHHWFWIGDRFTKVYQKALSTKRPLLDR